MSKTFIIAEIGINHCGKMSIAKKLIGIAKRCGADAVKFQTYKTEKLIKKNEPLMSYQKINMHKNKISQYEMLKKCELSYNQHKLLFNECKKKKIEFISTPYDFESAMLLNKLGVKTIKIASTDTTNTPFIKKLFKLKKKTIISTGATSYEELKKIINILSLKKKRIKIVILHCISYYPTEIKELNLSVIKKYKKKFGIDIGFSDHSLSLSSGSIAVALGASVIEKHITLNKNLDGPDHKASLNPKELKIYIQNIRDSEKMIGDGNRRLLPKEKKVKNSMQKSIYLNNDKKKNERILLNDLIIMRPGKSIKPYYINKIIGKKLKVNKRAYQTLKISEFN